MRLQAVAHPVGTQVTSQEHDRICIQRDVTQSRVRLLKHGVEHILHGVSALTELIKHDDCRLACVNTKPCVGVVAGRLRVVVNHGHGNVTQVHVRHVDIRMFVAQTLSYALQ